MLLSNVIYMNHRKLWGPQKGRVLTPRTLPLYPPLTDLARPFHKEGWVLFARRLPRLDPNGPHQQDITQVGKLVLSL